jgi:hypothetical protein
MRSARSSDQSDVSKQPPIRHRLASWRLRSEGMLWSIVVRTLLTVSSTQRAIRILDALPRLKPRSNPTAALPPEAPFRRAGACLGRSLARSQYLRIRGRPHIFIIGVAGGVNQFEAHAWLAGDAFPADFQPLWEVHR